MRFYPPQTALSQLTTIRRDRMFPGPGEILVQEGDKVDPVHIIAHAYVPGGISVVNVANALEVRNRSVRRYLKVENGQQVKKGDILAARGTVGKRTCRSPIDGKIAGIGGGQLLIEAKPRRVEVLSGYHGTVARTIGNRGVSFQISGALIQGAWGNGKHGFGILRVLVESQDAELKGSAIDASCRGLILVGGSGLDRDVLNIAIELQIRGIIVGAIKPELIDEAEESPFPIMATEGIGTIPMSARIFQLISTHDGREANIDAQFQSRWGIARPEIIVPLPAEPGAARIDFRETPLQVGDRVRGIRAPHVGLTGTVVSLPETPMRAATGICVPMAKVRPEDGGEPLLIPIANLEIPL